MPETKDLLLRKAIQSDWKAMYENIWQYQESAQYMLWDVTTSEDAAYARMERTIRFQSEHEYHWTVVEKHSGQPIGWAGMQERSPGIWEECGIALGPAFTGNGYGKQLLMLLMEEAKCRGCRRFIACFRAQNDRSRGLTSSLGFRFTHAEEKVDPRNGEPYTMEYYEKEL